MLRFINIEDMTKLTAPKKFYIKAQKPVREEVESLFAFAQETPAVTTLQTVATPKKSAVTALKNHFKPIAMPNMLNVVTDTLTLLSNNKIGWVAGSLVSFAIFSSVFIMFPPRVKQGLNSQYSIYSAKPLTLGETNTEIVAKDSRAQKINNVFRDYKCPLEGMGDIFVQEADKNNIPWWIVAAISFQESNCGKKTPQPDGQESYNAWGYAVYGGNVHTFDNWARGVETMSKYLSKRFFSQGITDPAEIMKTYTPPSNGSWQKGVNYFGDLIKGYSTL